MLGSAIGEAAKLRPGWLTQEELEDINRFVKFARHRKAAQGGEEDWIELQGYVYGARMHDADAFEGAAQLFRRARQRRIDLCIISYRTQRPRKGPRYDLHEAARAWLELQGFHDADGICVPRERVFFELTKQEKLARIASLGCTHFIDDLPEFLGGFAFPDRVERILFDPSGAHLTGHPFRRVGSWAEIERLLLGRNGFAT